MITGKHHCQWDQLPRRAVGTERRSLTVTLWLSLFSLTQPFEVLFLVLVVLVVFCCLCFKRSIFFPPAVSMHTNNTQQQKERTRITKTPYAPARTPFSITSFQLSIGGQKKKTMLASFSSINASRSPIYTPLSFSLSSHIFLLLGVSMMVQIIFS